MRCKPNPRFYYSRFTIYDSLTMFRFTTAGESHGRALVAIVEGLPAGLPIDIDQINHELWRRQQGYGRGARMKIEQDRIEILSGVRHGLTLGSPLALMIENKDWANWNEVMAAESREMAPEKSRRVKRPRPGHADLAGGLKYDAHDLRNVLERASARETAARVACGAIAKQLLAQFRHRDSQSCDPARRDSRLSRSNLLSIRSRRFPMIRR